MKTLHCYGNWNWIVLLALFVLLPVTSLAVTPKFVSLERRFSISLPEQSSSSKLVIPTPFDYAVGTLYEWQTKEGTFGIGYADAFQPITT